MKSSHLRPIILDGTVIFTMVVLSIVSLAVTGFRYISYQPCIPISISTKDVKLYAGRFAQFSALGEEIAGNHIVWNFGEKSVQQSYGAVVWHMYAAPGRYVITVTADNSCQFFKNIVVEAAPVEDTVTAAPQFAVPLSAVVGERVFFNDSTPGAVKWEWMFGETGMVDETNQHPSYVFKTPGEKTITLKVNGRIIGEHFMFIEQADSSVIQVVTPPKDTSRQIHHHPKDTLIKKDHPDAVPLPKRDISDGELEEMLKGLVDKKYSVSDFSDVLGQDLNTITVYNKESMTFQQCCAKLQATFEESKDIKKLTVSAVKKDNRHVILFMEITATKKSFFRRLLNM